MSKPNRLPFGAALFAMTFAVAVLMMSQWGRHEHYASAESQAGEQNSQSNGDSAPDFMRKGARLRAATESIGSNEVIVRDVQKNWVLVELVLPQSPAINQVYNLRWINLSTEKGYWSPLEPGAAEPK